MSGERDDYDDARDDGATARPAPLPYPESLCHRCAAPPRYIESKKGSVFILCPLLDEKYPRQPVLRCPLFTPREG